MSQGHRNFFYGKRFSLVLAEGTSHQLIVEYEGTDRPDHQRSVAGAQNAQGARYGGIKKKEKRSRERVSVEWTTCSPDTGRVLIVSSLVSVLTACLQSLLRPLPFKLSEESCFRQGYQL